MHNAQLRTQLGSGVNRTRVACLVDKKETSYVRKCKAPRCNARGMAMGRLNSDHPETPKAPPRKVLTGDVLITAPVTVSPPFLFLVSFRHLQVQWIHVSSFHVLYETLARCQSSSLA